MDEQAARIREMVDDVFSGTEAGRSDFPGRSIAPRYAGAGPSPVYQAVEDVCWIHQNANLAENLRRYGWREARRRVMRYGQPGREWISHRGHPPVRLTRRGVEVKLESGIERIGWQKMQDQIRARRS